MNPFGIVWYKGDSKNVHPGTLGLPSYHGLGDCRTLGETPDDNFGLVFTIISIAVSLLSTAGSLWSSISGSPSTSDIHKQQKMEAAKSWIQTAQAALTMGGYPWEGVTRVMDLKDFGIFFSEYSKAMSKLGYQVKVYQNKMLQAGATTPENIPEEARGEIESIVSKVETLVNKVYKTREPMIEYIQARGWDPSNLFPDLKGADSGVVPSASGVVPGQQTLGAGSSIGDTFKSLQAGMGTWGMILIGALALGFFMKPKRVRRG